MIKLNDLADILETYPNDHAKLLRMMETAEQSKLLEEVRFGLIAVITVESAVQRFRCESA